MSATPPGQGRKSYLQWGIETTWGTAVAATNKLEIISESVTAEQDEIPDPSLYNGRSPRATYQGRRFGRGDIVVRGNYEGILPLFKLAMPGYSNTLVETGVRDHFFKEGAVGSLGSATL